jgi:hypothetical protein
MPHANTIALSRSIKAAVAAVDITDLVSLETRGRHHGAPAQTGRLTGRVLMLTDGRQELVLIALDLLELYEPWMQRFKHALWSYLRVPTENIHVWCNHIHAASNSDGIAEVPLADRLAWAIGQAREDYALAEWAYAGKDLGPGWTIRRRFAIDDLDTFCVMFNDDGHVEGDRLEVSSQVRTYLRDKGVDSAAWSGHGKPAYCESPADTRLELLSLRRRDDRRPLTSILRFAAHPVIASHSKIGNALYPDFIGALRRRFEREFGSTALFLQGPCGDIRPLHERYGVDAADAYGQRLAGEAAKLVKDLRYQSLERAGITREFAQVRLRPEYRWSLARVAKEWEATVPRFEAEKDPAKRLALGRRMEVLRWVEFHRVKRPTIIPPAALQKGTWPMEVSAVRLGGVVLANLPGEIFASTGVAVREALGKGAAARPVMVTELAGPYANYVSPAQEYGSGGYEDTCCFLDGKAESALRAAAIRAARDMRS